MGAYVFQRVFMAVADCRGNFFIFSLSRIGLSPVRDADSVSIFIIISFELLFGFLFFLFPLSSFISSYIFHERIFLATGTSFECFGSGRC